MVVLAFELGCGSTKNECLDAWSMRGIDSSLESFYGGLLLIIARDVFRNVINRRAKVELHLCACNGDNPGNELPIYANDDELYIGS